MKINVRTASASQEEIVEVKHFSISNVSGESTGNNKYNHDQSNKENMQGSMNEKSRDGPESSHRLMVNEFNYVLDDK